MRQSESKPKLQGIEAARGLAAAIVVVYHSARHLELGGFGRPWFLGLEYFGHAGVDFFFVLSGFIILFVHWNDVGRPSSLPRYVERRCVRIYPLYWVILAISVTLAVLGSRGLTLDLPTIAANVTLFPFAGEPIVGVAWTLQHEMLFYALFAVALVRRGLAPIVLAAWVVLIGATQLGFLDLSARPALRVVSSTYNLQFLMGMAAAFILRRSRVPAAGTVATVGALAFAAVGLAEVRGLVDGYGDLARLLYGAAAFLVVLGLVERERSAGLRVPALLGALGKASYSIYLGHLLAIGVTWKVLERLGWTERLPASALILILLVAGLAGGVLLSVMIEYPIMARARALWTRALGPASPRTAR